MDRQIYPKIRNNDRRLLEEHGKEINMKDNKYTEIIGKYRAEAKNTELPDSDMTNAKGGVGGANEATCPYCGKSMKAGTYDIGKGWKCNDCGLTTDCSDAEYIQIIRYMEQAGISDISYPIWWNKI